jgi:hypothetical protein
LLATPPLIVIDGTTVAASTAVSVRAVTAFSLTMLSMLLVPVTMLLTAANSNNCTEEREKRKE